MIEARMKIDKRKFGKFVARRRKALSDALTQDMLAKRLHVGTSAIGKIEAGETLPSFELFIDLADALEMTPGDLMMVMAERETNKIGYMELNDWLYDKLVGVVEEYEGLFTAPQDRPQLPAGQGEAQQERRIRDMHRGRGVAKKAPEVEGAKPAPALPEPNSEANPDENEVDKNPTKNVQ